jgi:radical SAM superfamily enzyme YgiQ (UPF0313 family)
MSWKLYQKARDIFAQEKGVIKKSLPKKLTIALIYPNTYYIGMSNLGFQKIYTLLNQYDDVLCERSFLPEPADIALHQKHRTPLFSLESQKPLKEFDLLAFSLSFELDYLQVLKILELAQIPLFCSQRTQSHPLVIAGGICATTNPEPLTDFIDLFLIGEGEVLLPRVLTYLLENIGSESDRNAITLGLASLPGVYYPSGYLAKYSERNIFCGLEPKPGMPPKIKRQWLPDLDQSPTSSQIITPYTEFSETFLVEVGRGCSQKCHFCLSGTLYQPLRFYSAEAILTQVKKGLPYTKRIGLISPDLTSFPDLLTLCQGIISLGGEISAPSLRINKISSPLLSLLASCGQKTITLAPEAGSYRLRKAINKDITDEEIFEAIGQVLAAGIMHMKLYFLIGLPTETQDDIATLVEMAKKVKHIAQKSFKSRKFAGNITLSLTTFIPKPSTPFERIGMETVESLKAKIKLIKRALSRVDNIIVVHDLPKWSYIQSLLARGDRLVGRFIYAAHCSQGNWPQVFKEINLNPDYYVYRHTKESEPLPWDILHAQ